MLVNNVENDEDNQNENSLREFSFENDRWGRSQVDAEDPNFLHEQMQFIEKSRKDVQYSREKDIKFTPLRHLINLFSIVILLIGLGHIISSAFVIKTSNSRFIGGVYAGAITFITGLYPTNHFQEIPIIWLIFLIIISLIASIVSFIFQKSDLLFINSLQACVNQDYSQYTGSKSYYYAAYTCQTATTVSCMCVDSSNTCFKYEGLPSQQCSYLISRLPGLMNVSYILAMVSAIVSGVYLILCLIAFFYPSLLSIWLMWAFFRRNKEAEHQRRLESEHHHVHSHLHHHTQPNGGQGHGTSHNMEDIGGRGVRLGQSDAASHNVDISHGHGDGQDHVRGPTAASPSPDGSLAQESSLRYKGQVDPTTGHKQGFGVFTYDNGDVYEGNFLNNKKHGMGCYTYKSGDVYTGSFQAGAKHGYGRYAFTTGDVYEGHYKSGVIHGRGRYTYADGAYYEGSFDMGAKSGYGIHSFVSGARYEGMWANSVAHGRGRYTYPNGQVYEGGFTHGQMDDATAPQPHASDMVVTDTDS